MTVDASAYRKHSRDQQDNNNFFDTGIIFPTTLQSIDVTGAEARVSVAAATRLVGLGQCHDRPRRLDAAVHRRACSSGRMRWTCCRRGRS